MRSRKRYRSCEGIFDAADKRARVLELEKTIAKPDFWNNQEEAQKILQARSRLDRDIETDARLAREGEDLRALAELADEGELRRGAPREWPGSRPRSGTPRSACC